MAAEEIAVKKYIVKLSEAERSHLEAAINKGKSPAKRLLKARIRNSRSGMGAAPSRFTIGGGWRGRASWRCQLPP